MIVEAYVLPYLGRSAGVVFWEGRRPPRPAGGRGARTSRGGEPDTLAVYAPGELSPGEVAALQATYVASLGRALRERGQAIAAGGTLFWWWLFGLVAAVLLALRALEPGPGYAWLALVAALTALPVSAAGVAWPLRGGRAGMAARLARRAARLAPERGADARAVERVEGLWRLARRLEGPPGQQLQELEGYCREQAWRQGARFYADRCAALGAGRRPGRFSFSVGWLTRLGAWLGGLSPERPPYAVAEMRAW